MEKEIQEKNPMKTPHTLSMEGRTRAKLTGVTAVSCFNEQEIVLETSEGELALLGENLHIDQLDLDAGQLNVTGSLSRQASHPMHGPTSTSESGTRNSSFSGCSSIYFPRASP